MSDVKKATAVISFRMQEVQQQLDSGQEVKPYTLEDAVLDPTLVAEAPFKEALKVEEREEVAAMGLPPKGAFHRVDVNALFGALKRDGEARLSDHIIDEEEKKSEEESQSEEENEHRTRGRGR